MINGGSRELLVGLVDAGSLELTEVPAASHVPEAWQFALVAPLPDTGNEVVLVGPPDTQIEIVSASEVLGSGIADPHPTASGLAGAGLRYRAFASGTVLYHDTDLTPVPALRKFHNKQTHQT